jgi:hypothetical protein
MFSFELGNPDFNELEKNKLCRCKILVPLAVQNFKKHEKKENRQMGGKLLYLCFLTIICKNIENLN